MAGPDSPKYAVNPETGQVMRNDGTGWAKVKTAKNQQGEILINEGGTWTPLPGRAPAAPSGFAAPPKMSIAQAADVAGAQGKEFGFADEASALKRSVGIPKSADKLFEINPFNRFLNIGLGAGTAIADAAGVKMSPKYTQAKDAENAQLAQARSDRPVTAFVSEVVQSLPYPGGTLRMGAPIVRETAKMLGLGSLQGAIYGFGSGEGEGRIESAGTGAVVGGALGAATPSVAAAALPVVRGTRTALANATDAIVEMFGGTGTAGQAYARQVAEAAVRRSMERSGMTPERILETLQRFGNKPAVLAEVIGQDAVNTLSSLTRRPGSTPQAAQDIIAERMGGFPERAADDLRQTTGLTDAQIRGEFGPELAARREAAAPAYTELFEQQGGVTSDRLTQLAGTNTLGPLIRRSQAAAEDLAVSQRRDPASVTPLEVLDLAKRELDDEIATAQRNQQNAELFRLQSLQTALLGELDELTGGQYAAARDLGGEAPRLQEARTQGEQALRPGVTRATVNEQVGALNPQDRAAFASGTASVIDESIAGGRMLPQRFRLPANREKVEAAFGPEAGGEFANRMTAEAELRDLASRWGPRQGSITGTVMESGPSEALDDGIRFATSIARGDRIGFINQAVSWMRRRGYNQQQIDAMGELLLSNPQEGLRRLGIQLPRLPGGGGAAAAGAAAGTPPPPAGAPPPQAPAPRTVGVAPATAAPVGAPAPTTPTRTSGIVGSGDLTNAAFGAGLGGIAPAESPEERARNMAIGAGIGGFARRGSQMLDDATRTVGQPRATSGRTVGAGLGNNPYFGRQSMRPPGSGPSAREIETQQQWATATPIVTQARTTAQTAQQAADAALQSKAPADIARAKDQKKTLVSQLQEAQASRAGMDTPEDARLAETLASLTENTSDPVLLSTQISAAKTSLDRLLTDIGSPVEGNLIPVKTNILTRTQAPRSAAEGPQERPSVTRYAEGQGDEVKPQGFGAGGSKTPERPKYTASATSVRDSYGEELFAYKEIKDGNGKPVAAADINIIPSEKIVSIRDINTRRDAKRQGYATSLVEEIQKEFPGYKIEVTAMTDDGAAFFGNRFELDADGFITGAKGQSTSPSPVRPMGFGAGTPKTPEQATPAPPFYSALERAVTGTKMARAPGEQWKATLKNMPGVKEEEIEFTGLNEWLDLQTGPVSRDDVANYVRQNGVQVEEVVRGEGVTNARRDQIQRETLPLIERRQALDEALNNQPRYEGWSTVSTIADQMGLDMSDPRVDEAFSAQPAYIEYKRFREETQREVEALTAQISTLQREYTGLIGVNAETDAKWSSYTLPGGENYREMLLTLPMSEGSVPPGYRLFERDGRWVLRYPDEMDVDFATRNEAIASLGKAESYRSSHWSDPNVLAHTRFKDRQGPQGQRVLALEEIQSDWHQAGRERGYKLSAKEKAALEKKQIAIEQEVVAQGHDATLGQSSRWNIIENQLNPERNRAVPNAPLKQTSSWTSLVLNRMIRKASDEGYDGIAWIPGDIQNGARVAAGDNRSDFYDKIVVNAANKIGKKYGARVEKMPGLAVDKDGKPVDFYYLSLTPDMKAKAQQEGFPLFAAAPFAAVGGAGLTLAGEQERNQRTVGKPKTSQSARTVGKAKTN